MSSQDAERFGIIVVGGGQAGLATGYHLARRRHRFVVLDAHERVGQSWRDRWDSLRLVTPASISGLPGLPFPADPHAHPTKDEVGDYLESYAAHFGLPMWLGVTVDGLRRDPQSGRFLVSAGDQRFEADQVVVATGAYQSPRVPEFASEFDPEILQLDTRHYRRPQQLRDGGVLVVGASNSGAEIAHEAATAGHPTWLSGRDTGALPIDNEGRAARIVDPILWFLLGRVMTTGNPLGRRMRGQVRAHGLPLERIRPKDLRAAGVHRVFARTVGVRDGRPLLDDGQVLDVASVVWATGFGPDYGWIELPVTGADGWPIEHRGVVEHVPGLYFVGLLFQSTGTSALVGGVGRDAAYIADRVTDRARVARRTPAGLPGPSVG